MRGMIEWRSEDLFVNLGEDHYYENQNIKNQKEHQKICKPSLPRKWLKNWSERQKSLCQKQSKTTYAVFPLSD